MGFGMRGFFRMCPLGHITFFCKMHKTCGGALYFVCRKCRRHKKKCLFMTY
jgi:hypothetical protein